MKVMNYNADMAKSKKPVPTSRPKPHLATGLRTRSGSVNPANVAALRVLLQTAEQEEDSEDQVTPSRQPNDSALSIGHPTQISHAVSRVVDEFVIGHPRATPASESNASLGQQFGEVRIGRDLLKVIKTAVKPALNHEVTKIAGVAPNVRVHRIDQKLLGLLERNSTKASLSHFVPINELTSLIESITREVLKQLPMSAPATEVPSADDDPFAAARARGATYARNEMMNSSNLSLDQAKTYANRTTKSINDGRREGNFYALVKDGNERGFRYPMWQFDADPKRLVPVLQALETYDLSCWVKHNFLTRPSADLQGNSPADRILNPEFEIDSVLKLAERRFGGSDQGAQ